MSGTWISIDNRKMDIPSNRSQRRFTCSRKERRGCNIIAPGEQMKLNVMDGEISAFIQQKPHASTPVSPVLTQRVRWGIGRIGDLDALERHALGHFGAVSAATPSARDTLVSSRGVRWGAWRGHDERHPMDRFCDHWMVHLMADRGPSGSAIEGGIFHDDEGGCQADRDHDRNPR